MSYGRLKQPKLKDKDYELSCQKQREALDAYIDEQARRINVDSAKKKAVVQHMDYEGFRQMVLGANIFTTKSQQLYNFSKGESQEKNLNKTFDEKKIEQTPLNSYEQQVVKKSEMQCNSFREFKKKFTSCKENEQNKILFCYNLIKQQNEDRVRKIFNAECQANILLKIINVFEQILQKMKDQKIEGIQNQIGFILSFFRIVLSIETMTSMSLLILLKKQKLKISSFLRNLKPFHTDIPELEEEIERMAKKCEK